MACNQARTGEMCNFEIDYSTVTGDKILAFVITSDLADCVLCPKAGQYQKFCYDVKAVGKEDSKFADLSHLVLGICDQISEAEIKNITVMVNGEEQIVDFGRSGNVELSTEWEGLMFNFPLNKVNGTMKLSFEVTEPRVVDHIDFCLFGEGIAAQGLKICGPTCK